MSIINTDQERTPPTTEQKQQQTVLRIQRQATHLFSQMGQTYEGIKQSVWGNQQGLTPQEVFDALGTNGAELFQLSALLVQAVNAAKPDTLDPAQPYEFTINEDGTVTVGDPV